jgi:hypothetical protein
MSPEVFPRQRAGIKQFVDNPRVGAAHAFRILKIGGIIFARVLNQIFRRSKYVRFAGLMV